MSILTRPLGSKSKGETPSTEVVVAQPRGKGGPAPTLSISPRANLLPPEIGQNHRRRAVRRGLRLLVVVAVLLAIGGVAGAWYFSTLGAQRLAAEQRRTVDLAAQLKEYQSVSDTTSGIALGKAAVKVGGSTDIDWASYLQKLQATLPAGVTLSNVTIDSAGITAPFEQSDVPLEGPRVATLTFTASSSTLPSIPDWIDGLGSLPGFADASPNSVTQSESGFEASVTMHITTDAYSYRFDPEAKKGADK